MDASTTRRRLLFVAESGTDVRLVEGLAARFSLELLARRIQGGVEISQPPAVPVPVYLGPPGRAAFAAFAFRRLRRLRSSDRVLVQGYAAAALAANLAARLSRAPTWMLVCSPLERYYLCRRAHPIAAKPFRPAELWALTRLARLNARLGRGYVVLSQHLAQVVRAYGTRRDVGVVPVYGVDTRRFRPRPPEQPAAALRRERGLPPAGHVIFFSSRIAPEKDADTLLAATRRLLDAGRNIWLLHRSGGYRELLDAAQRHGVARRVIATDAVDPRHDLVRDYQASDVCVQASREEGLGFSALEALACEVPVVASAVGGLRETILDGHTGWTYPAGDVEALVRRLVEVFEHPQEAARRAAEGRRLVERDYEATRVFDRLAQILEADGCGPDRTSAG